MMTASGIDTEQQGEFQIRVPLLFGVSLTDGTPKIINDLQCSRLQNTRFFYTDIPALPTYG